jgi:hypothetical protein
VSDQISETTAPISAHGPGAVEGAALYDLTTRLARLEAQVEAERQTTHRRFGGMASAVALGISIFVGLFTIFDRVVTKPSEEKSAEYNQLKADIRSIITIGEDATEKNLSANDQNRIATAQAAYSQTQSLLQDAERLLKLINHDGNSADRRFSLGSADYGILAQAAYAGGDVASALKYADDSVDAADNFHVKSESLRTKAVMIATVGGPGAIQSAEATIKQAVDSLASRSGFQITIDRAYLYSTQATIEANGGDCAASARSAQTVVDLVSGSEIAAPAQHYVFAFMGGGLTGQSRCPLAGYSEAVRAALSGGERAPAQAPPGIPAAPPDAGAAGGAGTPQAGTGFGGVAAAAPTNPGRLTYNCRFRQGPRAGQLQSYAGVPGVAPVLPGTQCGDNQGSTGTAE